jgi:hypothetical protein
VRTGDETGGVDLIIGEVLVLFMCDTVVKELLVRGTLAEGLVVVVAFCGCLFDSVVKPNVKVPNAGI